jgi:hypothetical protein
MYFPGGGEGKTIRRRKKDLAGKMSNGHLEEIEPAQESIGRWEENQKMKITF